MDELKKIFVHLPAYREPELVPTIENALETAKHPERLTFGIFAQIHPSDSFNDDLNKFIGKPGFSIKQIWWNESQGLPYARAKINKMMKNEDYILQLDAHHRFVNNWDEVLISMHESLENEGYNPVLTGYLPLYNPHTNEKSKEPWMQTPRRFFKENTIKIMPRPIPNWESLQKPIFSRFISGHFAFAKRKWAEEIKHDPNIFFFGEELNLTLRSFTHGYDLFHPHQIVIWHATLRLERLGKLVWDDLSVNDKISQSRARVRQLLRVEDSGIDLTNYDIGNKRTIREYEMYAGIHFKLQGFQLYTLEEKLPPNPIISNEEEWINSFKKVFEKETVMKFEDIPEKAKFLLIRFLNEKNEVCYENKQDVNSLWELIPGTFKKVDRFHVDIHDKSVFTVITEFVDEDFMVIQSWTELYE